MNEYQFHFSELNFILQTDQILDWPEAFRPFCEKAEGEDITIRFQKSDSLAIPCETKIFDGPLFQIYRDEDKEERIYRTGDGTLYAVGAYEASEHLGMVKYSSIKEKEFAHTDWCFRHLGLEQILLGFKRLLFHASLIESPWGGICFSGVSGIGKSTQAALWERFRQTPVINGDRPIIYRKKDGWYGSGSPYAGSSKIYVDRSIPIKAIIFLEQSPVCEVQPISLRRAFAGMYEATVLNTWNRAYMEQVTALLEELLREVPCCILRCTPDERAVETLESWMKKGGF